MRRPAIAVLGVFVASTLLAGCGLTRGEDSGDLQMLIPNSPEGGYDQTGRAAVEVMEADDVTGGSFEVTNVIGAGGAAAMGAVMGKEATSAR